MTRVVNLYKEPCDVYIGRAGRGERYLKLCRGCGYFLPFSLFGSHGKNKDGKQTQCKDCVNLKTRAWWARIGKEKYAGKRRGSQYGLSQTQVAEMITAAKGRCACCHKKSKLLIDHNHRTGVVRGLICNYCNLGIGHIESPGFLEQATKYLSQEKGAGY